MVSDALERLCQLACVAIVVALKNICDIREFPCLSPFVPLGLIKFDLDKLLRRKESLWALDCRRGIHICYIAVSSPTRTTNTQVGTACFQATFLTTNSLERR